MKYVFGNWKMNLGGSSAEEFAHKLRLIEIPEGVFATVCPPATSLNQVAKTLTGTNISVGCQNTHWSDVGACTGEISPLFVLELGGSLTLAGHSERRHGFGETSEIVAKRVVGAVKFGLLAVACIGETREEREKGRTYDVLRHQLTAITALLGESKGKNLIVAYEPVWAIGTGVVAGPNEIAAAHEWIHRYFKETWADTDPPPILYGGSVTPDNFAQILNLPHVAGGLIGGASLKVESFEALIRIAGDRTL